MVKGIPALLDLGKSTQLSVDGAHAVVLGIAVTQRLVTFEGVSFPLDELRRLGDNVRIRGLRERGDAGGNVLIGHFQSVATAARHFDFFPLSGVVSLEKVRLLRRVLRLLVLRWCCCCSRRKRS